MTEEGYKSVERNIHRRKGGFRVMLTRRGIGSVYGGLFQTIEEARTVRDELEKKHPPGKPWDNTARVAKRRTVQQRRMERRAAGMCQECGEEPPAPGILACRSCRDVNNFYRQEQRRREKEQQQEGQDAEQ
jgi:hypothetical protein